MRFFPLHVLALLAICCQHLAWAAAIPAKASSYHIDQIEIQGNRRSKNATILRELDFKSGDVWSQKRIDIGRQRLLNTRLFSEVDIQSVFNDSDHRAKVTVIVQERFAILPLPTFTHSDRGDKAGLDYKDYNFMGLGHTLGVSWGHVFSSSGDGDRFRIRYENPRINDSLYGGFANLGYAQIDEDHQDAAETSTGTYRVRAVDTSIGINHQIRVDLRTFTLGGFYFYEHNRAAFLSGSDVWTPHDNAGLGLSISYDTVKSQVLTFQGYRANASLSQSLKALGGDFNELTLRADTQRYWLYANNANLVVRLALANQFGETGDNLLSVGGDNSVRGYKPDDFSGTRSLAANVELRSPLWYPYQGKFAPHYGAVVFIDAGNAWARGQNLEPWNLHTGVGGGLRVIFKKVINGILRLDVGYGLDSRSTVVYAGIGQNF